MFRRVLPVLVGGLLLLSAGAAPGGEAAPIPAAGRMVSAPLPVGGAGIYLPAGHDPAKSWPVVVFLPGREGALDAELGPWLKLADELGFVLAFPVPATPDPQRGYPDLIIISLARGAVSGASGDEGRVAIVGHLSGGRAASAVAYGYPRLARAVAAVGTVPSIFNPPKDAVDKCPAVLLAAGKKDVLEKCRARQQDRKDLAIEVLELPGAEGAFGERSVREVMAWVGRRVEMGARERAPEPVKPADPKACAAGLAEAEKLAAAGAAQGAYVVLLGAARADRNSAKARVSLADNCLTNRRWEEAADWAREAVSLEPKNPRPRMLLADALLRLGRPKEALAELEAAGAPGRDLAGAVRKRLPELSTADPQAAREAYAQAVEFLAAGDYRSAAAAARQAIRQAPTESACRVLAVYAVFNVEGLAAARKGLDSHLELFPGDPHVRALAEALDGTARADYSVKGLPARAVVPVARLLPVAPAPALLTALAAKAGLAAEDEELSKKLAERVAEGDLRGGMLFLEGKGLALHVGSGSLADLKAKLAAGIPVLVQLPPGELAGLRDPDRYGAGVPRLTVGYDDQARCVLVRDYGARGTMGIPYGLFDLLWSRLDRWWLAVMPAGKPAPGAPGLLTALELATARAEAGDAQKALEMLDSPAAAQAAPLRRRLARGMLLWRTEKPDEARKELDELAGAPPEFSVPALMVLGTIAKSGGPGRPADPAAALQLYRRAWQADPANESATLALVLMLVHRGGPEGALEAKTLLEDYLRLNPASLGALGLRYML